MKLLRITLLLINMILSIPAVSSWTASTITTRIHTVWNHEMEISSPSLDDAIAAASRRSFFRCIAVVASTSATLGTSATYARAATDTTTNTILTDLTTQLQHARQQLTGVPSLIEKEQWDSVRAILIVPPLADCWAKTNRPLVTKYAEALGDAGGDELAALEAREDLVSHLRYLDMAVYNNVFNPITVEGKTGATKELVRSYYEDPINEYRATLSALDELIRLAQ